MIRPTLILAVVGGVGMLTAQGRPVSAQSESAFEVASIKRSAPDATGGVAAPQPGGRYVMLNGPVRILINLAYPSPTSEIVNAPDWVATETYDVTAVAGREVSYEQTQAMMRTLLADRFKLVAHYDKREQTTYNLTVARPDRRLGPQLRPITVDCDKAPPQPPPRTGPVPPCVIRQFPRGTVESGAMTMEALATTLTGLMGRVVTDRTRLAGDYAVKLQFTPQRLDASAIPPSGADSVPSLFTALEEQLGLKLEPTRSLVEVLVIDSVERPTPD